MLFTECPLLKTPSFKLLPIRSVGDFLREIKKIENHHSKGASNEEKVFLYFRGESKCTWNLTPAIRREDSWRKAEGEMLRELISRRPEDLSNATSALAEWVLAQHHGLPTRFLDVTRNPLVAIFNASRDDGNYLGRLHVFVVHESLIKPFNSDTVSIISNLAKLTQCEQNQVLGRGGEYNDLLIAKLRLYQNIKKEKPYFEERIDIRDLYKVFVVEPQQSSERLRAQSGAFLASAFHDRFEPEKVRSCNERIPVYTHYKLTIPSECKKNIKEELRLLNITEETLLPGLDSSAKAVKETYSRQK